MCLRSERRQGHRFYLPCCPEGRRQSVHPENQDDMVYHHNPMLEDSNSNESVPLLRRVDNVEHETKSVKAKTESIEAKTENIEAKTERMEEMFKLAIKEMNEKMEKLANSSNAL